MAKKRMNKAVVLGDESKLDMTPMIDMTFLLVVFFMLSIDLTTKEFIPVDLPFAYKDIEDTPENQDDKTPRFIINLQSNGEVVFKGQSYTLSSEDKHAQETTLRRMREELVALTRDPKYREDDGASMIPVMIHGDRMAKWKYVQWIMQVCAHPSIKIYRLQFAVRKPVTENKEG